MYKKCWAVLVHECGRLWENSFIYWFIYKNTMMYVILVRATTCRCDDTTWRLAERYIRMEEECDDNHCCFGRDERERLKGIPLLSSSSLRYFIYVNLEKARGVPNFISQSVIIINASMMQRIWICYTWKEQSHYQLNYSAAYLIYKACKQATKNEDDGWRVASNKTNLKDASGMSYTVNLHICRIRKK